MGVSDYLSVLLRAGPFLSAVQNNLRSLPLGDSAAFISNVPSDVGITVEGKERPGIKQPCNQKEGLKTLPVL